MAGNIIIVEPRERFKRVSLEAIRNERIDLFTLGMYTRLLVLGKDWSLNINGLSSLFGVGAEKIRNAVGLLEEEGFIRRECVRDEVTGKLGGWNYYIYADAVPENERTALRKNRNTEKTAIRLEPQYGEDRITENHEDNNNILNHNNRPKKNNKPNNTEAGRFDFRRALVELGVPDEIVSDWLEVRKKKNASNTRTAFNKIKNEIEKAGIPAADCIRICAENSWRGFEAAWLVKDQQEDAKEPEKREVINYYATGPKKPQTKDEPLSDYYRRMWAELQKEFAPKKPTDNGTGPDEQ